MTAPAICFDATGTLIETSEPVGEVYRRIALAHHVDLPAWRLDDAFRRVVERAPARGVDGHTFAERRQHEVDWWFERIRQTFQATDSTVRFADFRAFATALFDAYRSADAWRPRAGIPEILATLRARGGPMAIVSNFDHRLLEILEALDLDGFFDFIAIPCRTGLAKPERALFEAVAQALGRPLEQHVYVGDDAPDVLEAIAALGIRVLDVHDTTDLAALRDLGATAATLPPRRSMRS